VPTNGTEDIVAMGIGVGVSHLPKKGQGAGNNIGLRLIWIPDAPANPLKEGSPDVGSAWGPGLDWQLMFSPRRRISVYTSLAFGFVYGKPDQNKMNTCCDGVQVDIDPDKNQVVPIFEGGVGLRILSPKMGNSKMRFFVSPELGYVPGIDAPYGALNFGLM